MHVWLCSSPLPFACTQRGEGLNRNLKPLLDLRSGLNKLYQEVTFRIEKETARTFQQDFKQTMHYSDLGGYAKQILPVLYAEACVLLTPYGLARWVKQLQASTFYTTSRVLDLEEQQQQADPQRLLDASTNEDPDLGDLPSCAALLDLVAQFNIDLTAASVFKVAILPLMHKDPDLVAQHVVLWDPLPGEGGVFLRHLCTCGSAVRGGVPCRHFWAAAVGSRQASFNFGQVNDLWFKEAQKLSDTAEVFTIDGQVSGIGACV